MPFFHIVSSSFTRYIRLIFSSLEPTMPLPLGVSSIHLRSIARSTSYPALMPTTTTNTVSHDKTSHLSRRLIRLDQHLREAPNAIGAADFLNEQRHLDDVEVLAVQVVDLLKVLLLHLAAGVALRTGVGGAGEEQLVDDHGVGIDFVGAEFLDHALGFVEGEELGDEDGDEAGG